MITEHDNDDEWLGRLCAGDEQALVGLMRKYYVHLAQYAHSLLGRHDLAQEAVSNVFVSLWRRRETLVIQKNVRSYLFGAVAKQASTLFASDVRRPELVPLDEVSAHELVSLGQADTDLLYQELRQQIDTLLATMPKQRQIVFRMSRFENMRYREISAVLGISELTVRSHIAKATRNLTHMLPALRNLMKGNSP